MFQFVLTVIMEEVDLAKAAGHHATATILSAKHGLLDPDSVVEPYDLAMTDRGSVPAAVVADQVMALVSMQSLKIHAFLPHSYLSRLQLACSLAQRQGGMLSINNHYRTVRGIGDQKHVLSQLRQSRSLIDSQVSWRQLLSGESTADSTGSKPT
nr:DUF6884 domain-containing protein [Kutzneria albida]